MISLPANATTVPSRKADRTELGAFLRGRRVRVGTRETGAATALRPDPVPPRDRAASRGGLAGRGEFTVRAAAASPDPGSEPGVPAFLHALLRQVEPFPAAVLSARWDILALNRSYDALFGLESVPARNRNAMLLYFTDPDLRELWPDWAADAPRVVGQIRAAMARHDTDPEWATLLERLRRASPDFDRMWRQARTGGYDQAPVRFRHPVTGVLRLVRFHLWAEPREDGLVAVGYTPADAATAAKLPRLRALSTLPAARDHELPPTATPPA
jgi:MmyB-like transcription regulator ligand binding domain